MQKRQSTVSKFAAKKKKHRLGPIQILQFRCFFIWAKKQPKNKIHTNIELHPWKRLCGGIQPDVSLLDASG